MKQTYKSGIAAVAAAGLFAAGGMSSAVAAKLITGDDIKNNSIGAKQIAKDSIGKSELKKNLFDKIKDGVNGADGADGADGAQGPAGADGAAFDAVTAGAADAKASVGATGAAGTAFRTNLRRGCIPRRESPSDAERRLE